MRALIVSGGRIDPDFALSYCKNRKYDWVIGVDRGLKFLYEHGIRPTHVVGDFDSADPGLEAYYRKQEGIEIRRFNPVKDSTDTQIAIELALELGSARIEILGGTGSRLDHVLANLELLSYGLTLGIRSCMVDAQNLIWASEGPRVVLKRKEQWGKYVSMFALGGPVEGLTLEGFLYPLEDHCLTSRDCGLTVSNEILAEEAVITFRKGCLLLVMSKD